MYPTTKQEWWSAVDQHWDFLYEILGMFLPYEHRDWEKNITETTLLQNALKAKRDRDGHSLARYFNMAWWLAPDDPSIHSIPFWGQLCDLCSEEYVLYDEQEEPAQDVTEPAPSSLPDWTFEDNF